MLAMYVTTSDLGKPGIMRLSARLAALATASGSAISLLHAQRGKKK